MGIISVNFDITGQLLIMYTEFIKYLAEKGITLKQCISFLLTLRKIMIQLEGRSCIVFSLSVVSP
jgi:hypothetical protein